MQKKERNDIQFPTIFFYYFSLYFILKSKPKIKSLKLFLKNNNISTVNSYNFHFNHEPCQKYCYSLEDRCRFYISH